ncbi:MAG: ATP-binding protein [Coxiellaceae bacterium]|nr:ATP-binding protein [Coxiellaceae bacterium]
MLERQAADILLDKAAHYPVVAVTGPRQSGKSTIVKKLFADKPYRTLEDLDHRQFAQEDPRLFLAQFPDGAVLDEIQHCPELCSYIQTIVDEDQRMGLFVLTGSNQLSMHAQISQSLAGRLGYVQLLPFTLHELQQGKRAPKTVEELLYTGLYPPIYDRGVGANLWYSDYLMTYLEKDVRQLLNVHDIRAFRLFLQMCAARTGQLLNLSSLANDCGITHNTAKAWLSVLEASYIIFLLQPHHQNFNKRLVKSPKIYFYDTGLACALLNIQHAESLVTHSQRGHLFETWVVSELIKYRFNQGLQSNLYFWRDNHGNEVDVIVDRGDQLIPIEVKSGLTINTDYFKGLKYWQALNENQSDAWLVYAGDETQQRSVAHVLAWLAIFDLYPQLL